VIDYGLLASMIIAFGIPSLVCSWWTVSGRDGPVGFLDLALGPTFAGLAVGRITTLALDDPSSIGSISDMLIIRSGVEFWPGVATAIAIVMVSAHLGLVSPSRRIAELAPLAMVGYAGYEAGCIFRDGCFGPDTALGLRPPGLSTTMLPIGWFMAVGVAVAAVGVHRLGTRGTSTFVVVLAAAFAVASVRAVGSIWLPHVGDGLTRQHRTSIAVAAITALIAAAAIVRRQSSKATTQS